jgi:hypothetical protein
MPWTKSIGLPDGGLCEVMGSELQQIPQATNVSSNSLIDTAFKAKLRNGQPSPQGPLLRSQA